MLNIDKKSIPVDTKILGTTEEYTCRVKSGLDLHYCMLLGKTGCSPDGWAAAEVWAPKAQADSLSFFTAMLTLTLP